MASIATEASTARCITDASTLNDIDDEDLPFLRSVVRPDEFLDIGLKVFYTEGEQAKVSTRTLNKHFVSHYGCLPVICAMLWETQRTTIPHARVQLFLMAFHHLKVSPTEMQAEDLPKMGEVFSEEDPTS
jgi:hypothetical protein